MYEQFGLHWWIDDKIARTWSCVVPLCPESKANSRQIIAPRRSLKNLEVGIEAALRHILAKKGTVAPLDAGTIVRYLAENAEKGLSKGPRPVLALSQKGKVFLKNSVMFFKSVPPPSPPITNREKIALIVLVKYADYRRDVDASLIEDALERAGILPNDRQFRWKLTTATDEVGGPKGAMFSVTLVRIGELPWKSTAKGKGQDNF